MNDLLKMADFEELPRSTVDLDAAVRTGRARERRNRVLQVTAVAAAVLVVAAGVALAADRRPAPRPVAPSPSPSVSMPPWVCAVEPVEFQIDAIDPTGRFTVTWPVHSSGRPPLLSADGAAPREMTGLPGVDPLPNEVNPSGVVIGSSSREPLSRERIGWVHRDGGTEHLRLPEQASWVEPRAINARGDIVGLAYDGSTTDVGGITALGPPMGAVLWPASPPGTVQMLSGRGEYFEPGWITDDGSVAGSANGTPTVRRPDGTFVRLAEFSNLTGISGDWAFGFMQAGGGGRYNIRTGSTEDLGTFMPWVALGEGRLAGEIDGGRDPGRPAIWHAGTAEPLPSPAQAESTRITHGGGRTVTAVMRFNGVQTRAVTWRC
ncbi:hypothetical protein OHA72_12745 [Dactylosporangium sp. NBC_01737]|uniref:hypothetical protein n=1 Tax=Dactylosporangium sp. NBC_01737 TaxID=2975959 RepID=UPI002E11690D|nr:hypothetical protein OHA72_12745 [Dactylosporangium sp. NBC_01737]